MHLDRRAMLGLVGASPLLASLPAVASTPAAEDARALIDLIFSQYAYRERLEGFPRQRLQELRAQAESVATARDLVRFGERALAAIFDHHAILNSSRADSYGLTPSFADLWIEARDGRFVVSDVRHNSPAERDGVRPGDVLVGVGGQSIAAAIAAFIEAPFARLTAEQQAYCACTLAAGHRDRPRNLVLARGGRRRALELANLYAAPIERGEGPLSPRREGDVVIIRINDSLGDDATVAAFDAAMRESGDAAGIVIDLRDTASGGNTFVARAMMGWFVDAPTPYQRHELAAESLDTGVRRSWIEEVSPRETRYRGKVAVLVGRWTGSMGEGLALGFDAIGADVVGSRMAGLLGAIYDLPLPNTGIVLKLPVERLAHVNGTPRELYAPPTLLDYADAPSADGADAALSIAIARVR